LTAPGPRGVVIVFAKAPRPGLVKTRMCPPLTPEQAADLYGCMLDDVLEATAGWARGLGLECVLAAHPSDALIELADRAPVEFKVVAQRGGGLAARMDHAIREACAGGFERVLLRGSDNPAMSHAHLREALALLDRHAAALTPDCDGGYGLVAVRAPIDGLFDHTMSSEGLLEATVDAARARGVEVALGAEAFDLDSIGDLARLDAWRRTGDETHICARTISWIEAHSLWPAPRAH
jgi:hypothetical protein